MIVVGSINICTGKFKTTETIPDDISLVSFNFTDEDLQRTSMESMMSKTWTSLGSSTSRESSFHAIVWVKDVDLCAHLTNKMKDCYEDVEVFTIVDLSAKGKSIICVVSILGLFVSIVYYLTHFFLSYKIFISDCWPAHK